MANPEHLDILKQGVEVWNASLKGHNPQEDGWLDLTGADLRDLDLRNAILSWTNLHGANLSGANLSGASLWETFLTEATLRDVQLDDAHIVHTRFQKADFQGTLLYKVQFIDADLSEANLRETDLNGTVFRNSRLKGADFTHTQLRETVLTDVDLRDAKGLNICQHGGPSTIDLRTLQTSWPLPLAFLRGCGLPESYIEYLPSLLGKPFEFYTCFISFTEKDDELAERLYNDLQGGGVRCWRWKEDAKLGRTLMRSIDEAVRVYDKLIVLCSEDSLQSPPVIREIERALQKEDDLARKGEEPEVLFPIRLDDYIFDGWDPYRKADFTQKNVGDFRQWETHNAYQKAFQRLLRDLKA